MYNPSTYLFNERVKQWSVDKVDHRLPVVAMGLIPHIYRRAAFPHRATPESLPVCFQE